MTRLARLALNVALASALLMGCGDEAVVGQGLGGATPSGGALPPPPAAPVDAGVPDTGIPALNYADDDFVEAESNRDPFRSFARMFKIRPPDRAQRRVTMPTTAIDQMRLVAIISGVPRPRAMLVDPGGVGHAVQRGDYIGRAEVIQSGGEEGVSVTLNWRVARIRPTEIVLERTTGDDAATLTRLLPLYEDESRQR